MKSGRLCLTLSTFDGLSLVCSSLISGTSLQTLDMQPDPNKNVMFVLYSPPPPSPPPPLPLPPAPFDSSKKKRFLKNMIVALNWRMKNKAKKLLIILRVCNRWFFFLVLVISLDWTLKRHHHTHQIENCWLIWLLLIDVALVSCVLSASNANHKWVNNKRMRVSMNESLFNNRLGDCWTVSRTSGLFSNRFFSMATRLEPIQFLLLVVWFSLEESRAIVCRRKRLLCPSLSTAFSFSHATSVDRLRNLFDWNSMTTLGSSRSPPSA